MGFDKNQKHQKKLTELLFIYLFFGVFDLYQNP